MNALKRHGVLGEGSLCKERQQRTATVKIQVLFDGLLLAQ